MHCCLARFWIFLWQGFMMGYLTDKVKEIERQEIVNALKECNWIMSRAARKLGITQKMIGYKVKNYNIRKEAVTIDSS